MATTKGVLRLWLERGKQQGATHMIVVCDTFDWSDYPVYVSEGEDARDVVSARDGERMQRVMEVYSISDDWDEQLNQHRCFNYGSEAMRPESVR